jgi:DNA-binding NtrC family response regulator
VIMAENANILVVENDPLERRELCQVLETLGFRVCSAGDGLEACARVKGSEFHMVVAGFETPGLQCADLCRLAAAGQRMTPVLFLSRTGSVADAVDAMKAGAFDFLMKPVNPEHLQHLLQMGAPRGSRADDGRRNSAGDRRIVTQDPGMARLLGLIDQVADSRASVMIQGESGTGKELIARYIHEHSSRGKGPFVAVNCGALPESLLESELFGHEKGAFTGAISRKPGKFELADGGTLLLDEVTEMAPSLQAKLLRVLQEREVDRLGGRMPVPVDIRVVATTNRDMAAVIEEGRFREDLFYRLNVIPLHIPPLRERPKDIPELARHFVEKYNAIDGRNVKSLAPAALGRLASLSFPGNVRELENIIERAVLLSDGHCIQEKDLFIDPMAYKDPPDAPVSSDTGGTIPPLPLREVEKKLIYQTLEDTNGNRTHAAKMLGISVRTLRNKLNEYKEGLAAE